jgi:predicted RNase H-like HicB family nuclease
MKNSVNIKSSNTSFLVYVEKDERGMYAAECPIFSGCYSQGPTIEKALENIREVIELCLDEEMESKNRAGQVDPETSFHSVRIALS